MSKYSRIVQTIGEWHLTDTPTLAPAGQSIIDANAYQVFLKVSADGDLFGRVEEQLESWLRNKKQWDAQTETTGLRNGPGGEELLILRPDWQPDRVFRARLVENTDRGTWRTTLTVHERQNKDAWLGLRVANGEGRFASVPILADYLLDALEVRDGDTWLTHEPKAVGESAVEELLEQVTVHDGRLGLFFVAATSEGTDRIAFENRVRSATREVRGLGQVVVLNAGATKVFNEAMGSSHVVPAETMRTYLPKVDPADPDDGMRHKLLGSRRLAGPIGDIRPLLGRVARRHAADRPRPAEFVRVDRHLARYENRVVLQDVRPAPSRAPEGEVLTAVTDSQEQTSLGIPLDIERLFNLVKSTLGLEVVDEQSLKQVAQRAHQTRLGEEVIRLADQQLEEQQLRVDQIEDELAEVKLWYEEEQLGTAILGEDIAKYADENRWLRQRLAELEDPIGAYSVVPPDALTEYPQNFEQLVERLDGLAAKGVLFTGSEKDLLALDEHDTLNKLVRVAWDALLALQDYVRARHGGNCDNGVRHYMEHTPTGFRNVPPKKLAEKETSTTMQAWGNLREFPVPTSVSKNGYTRMEAHFKLGRVGMVSPRMYFLDRWSLDQRVYVGYIGSHLRNTQTN